uniref:Uncharacterized protein n=1 Tax=Triticum urartu TaxID=4572 RepID=A0A8R7UPX5_TRIUA
MGVFRPSDDRSRAAASFAAVSFLSLKNPNDGREQTGTLSTTGVEYDRSITRERDRRLEWTLPAGELELRSSPWNTILPEDFMRGESTEATDGGGGVAGRRRAGLCAARGGADAGGGQWRCGGAEAGGGNGAGVGSARAGFVARGEVDRVEGVAGEVVVVVGGRGGGRRHGEAGGGEGEGRLRVRAVAEERRHGEVRRDGT